MRIAELTAHTDWTFLVAATDGRIGKFDLRPYLQYEAFEELNDISEFMKIKNGGYFVEWECGADLSADTIEAKMSAVENALNRDVPPARRLDPHSEKEK